MKKDIFEPNMHTSWSFKTESKSILRLLALSTKFSACSHFQVSRTKRYHARQLLIQWTKIELEWFQGPDWNQKSFLAVSLVKYLQRRQAVSLAHAYGTISRRKRPIQKIIGKARNGAHQLGPCNDEFPRFPCMPTPPPQPRRSRETSGKCYSNLWKEEEEAEGRTEKRVTWRGKDLF